MDSIPVAAWMFPAAFALIFAGIPISLSLIVVAVAFAIPIFGDLAGLQLYRFVGNVASNYTLAAVPLFIFMGAVLEQSGIGRRVFEGRSEEHTSELQSLMRISYAVFCLKKKKTDRNSSNVA